MTTVKYSDQVKLVPEGYNIITAPTVKGMTYPKLGDIQQAIEFYKPLIEEELGSVPGGKDPYLDSIIVLTHIYQESLFNSRANNSYPARGIAQFIPGTQKQYNILDPYNYADVVRPLTKFVNDNFKHYSSIKEKDLHISCGVMAYFSGRRTLEGFKKVRDEMLGINPLQYLQKFEVTYRRLGGPGFRSQW